MAYRIFVIILFLFTNSIVSAQYEFLSPIPNSRYHNIETNIIFRDGDLINPNSLNSNSFDIYSFSTGNHTAQITLSPDGKTVIINPDVDFNTDDKIYVSIQNIVRLDGSVIDSLNFYFFTTKNGSKNLPYNENYISVNTALYKTKSIPESFPDISTLAYDNPYEGYIFFQNTSGYASYYDRFISIIDHNLNPYLYIQDNNRGLSFTKQKNGQYSFFNPYGYSFYTLDTTFAIVDSFACGNGYNADFHDFQLLENGNSYLLAYDVQIVDMSEYIEGGEPEAQVTGVVIQGLDSQKNVIFQFRTWDYFEFADALHYVDLTSHYFAYAHTNSIDIDENGNVLISNYLMDELTLINGKTGNIKWRFGGKNNQFTFLNDTIGFTTQHDARRLSNGNITLFDNGLFHTDVVSSAKEYELDEVNKTARLVWGYTHPLHFSSPRSGNVQRLPNGNTFINWGWRPSNLFPSMTEVRPDSTIVHEISFAKSDHLVYRAYKFIISESDSTDIIVDKKLKLSKINAYPNPAQDFVIIDSNFENSNLRVQDVSGKDISCQVCVEKHAKNSSHILNTSSLSTGLYIYIITSGVEIQSGKFVIIR
ncbi:MAG TPA: hypothetical protein DDX39_00400 [Bacteroidales bacterium]|nr:MAG: hypothetical protein A2W98_03155 [Bacteroidetes bacterium GWF2_33_38]HBF87070.1 hypothetical protein [Bacteroidales bacterium]